ncbi:MAG: PQQ-binding-like beta-propeller repeat protein [Planctomycetaceae bacterium]|nr:PQQ-binding-like beta-propeller repeat protein [Planctomycetaceae bacterium]MBT6154508.1 PQQ-binding-like beta-propeller repeat protein [Planctomycetaceae bacterium]MBT6486538.1 PQQ-binding-like beta-propeller repeat protein [Planctomycetaceae bacterium]MBT6497965.1 PQQ-binding-like beta-propeller repeat protein [Planctomycetaceae bacterium]
MLTLPLRRSSTGLAFLFCAMTVLGLFGSTSSAVAQESWSRFRGVNGNGISDQKGIPTTWSPGDYAWNIELPGVGHASPIVWKDKLFVTSAIDEGALRFLFCLNPATGKEIWSRQVGFNRSHKHSKNSWASSTPATDGKRVYLAFSDDEHYTFSAYDFDGDLVWQRLLGGFESQHGQGVSPILFNDLVIIANLQKGPSSVVALDKNTGRTVWSSVHSFYRTSYATPIIVRLKGDKPQLICASGALGVASLDPQTGRLNWMTGEFPEPRRTVASPIVAGGLLIQSCGGGGRGNVMIAVDLSDPKDATKNRIRYERKKVLPYVPTPIYYGGHLFLWNDNGVVSCVKPEDGENLWTIRVGGGYSGSPICIDGKLYCITEKGDMIVVPATVEQPAATDIQRTSLGDTSHSTPIVAGGRLLIRTYHRLAALEAKP